MIVHCPECCLARYHAPTGHAAPHRDGGIKMDGSICERCNGTGLVGEESPVDVVPAYAYGQPAPGGVGE
jgi:hypothetical protein